MRKVKNCFSAVGACTVASTIPKTPKPRVQKLIDLKIQFVSNTNLSGSSRDLAIENVVGVEGEVVLGSVRSFTVSTAVGLLGGVVVATIARLAHVHILLLAKIEHLDHMSSAALLRFFPSGRLQVSCFPAY